MLCENTKSLVYGYLTQLRVSAVNAEILQSKKSILEFVVMLLGLDGRWEGMGDPENYYGAEDLIRGRWYRFKLGKNNVWDILHDAVD